MSFTPRPTSTARPRTPDPEAPSNGRRLRSAAQRLADADLDHLARGVLAVLQRGQRARRIAGAGIVQDSALQAAREGVRDLDANVDVGPRAILGEGTHEGAKLRRADPVEAVRRLAPAAEGVDAVGHLPRADVV